MGFGIGQRWSSRKVMYEAVCPVCNEVTDLTKRQYLDQLRFKCVTCQALRPIPEQAKKVRI